MTTAFKPKHQRLVLVILALVAILAAGALAAWALKNQGSSVSRISPPAPCA